MRTLSDLLAKMPDLEYWVVAQYINGRGATDIADDIKAELTRRGITEKIFTRESVHQLLRQMDRSGHLLLRSPLNEAARNAFATEFNRDPRDIHVVDVKSDMTQLMLNAGAAENDIPTCLAFQAVVDRAGDVAFQLIDAIGLRKQRTGNGKPQVVHVGIGAGQTTRFVCGRLAKLLRTEHSQLNDQLPRMNRHVAKIVFHAISSGFDPLQPLNAPTAMFALFEDSRIETEFVGLFTNAVVPSDQFELTKTLQGVVESFDRRDEIEFVISSFASGKSQRGLWNKYARAVNNVEQQLEQHGWVGDFQFRPYSNFGPIVEDIGIRAVTLFELSDFVDFTSPEKQVLLVAPPGKSDALFPLLTEPDLNVWTHLVTDVRTVEKLLQ
jgi:hypothetical protein